VGLVDAKDDGLVEAAVGRMKPCQVARDGLGACPQRHHALEIFGLVFLVGHGAPVAVQARQGVGRQPSASTSVTIRCTR
jgi:hypothetical protein